MKFGKRLCSMLFEIYPEATHIELTKEGVVVCAGDFCPIVDEYFPCEQPEDGVTEYKREDVFVYGDEVDMMGKITDIPSQFICYEFHPYSIVYTNWNSKYCRIHLDELRKPQEEEMVTVLVWKKGCEHTKHEIPLSKAKELGLI